jgi:uncharacterized RmlC-like cupin family protein
MTDGVMLPPGGGRLISGGGLQATLKVAASHPAFASSFEVVLPPGYDAGAHVHVHGEEVFYVVSGRLDVFAFEPADRSGEDWHEWRTPAGQQFLSGGPGAFMYVPPGTPHGFANTSDEDTTIFFQSSAPGGHDNYFDELAALLRDSPGRPSQEAITDLRTRYDIEQLTPLRDRRP